MSDEARTILLTGANGGLGRAIAARIVSTSHLACSYGLYTVRGLDHQGQLETILDSETQQHQHEILALDLSQLSAVRKFASNINERVRSGSLPPIKAIILNAAYQEYSSQSFTVDGFDMTFQCTYLSHWLLLLLLLQSMDKVHCRIVIVGSSRLWSREITLKAQVSGYTDI